MKNAFSTFVVVVASFLAFAALPVACATVIDFDNVPSGTDVTTQYAGAQFTSETGLTTIAYAYLGPSPFGAPNVLVPFNPTFGFPTSVPDLYVDFTTPVNNLGFHAVAADEYGTIAQVKVYSGLTLLGIDPIIGNGPSPGNFGNAANATTYVNLSAYSNITRIEVVPPTGLFDLDSSYGGGGLIYDDFTFDPVPEPSATLLLSIAAFAATTARRQKILPEVL